jgi:hypothetical protein
MQIMRKSLYLLSALLISSCSAGPPNPDKGQYPLSTAQASDLLRKADLTEFKLAFQCGLLVQVELKTQSDKELTWAITTEGTEMMSFKAILVPISENVTQVDIDVSKAPDGNEHYDGKFVTDRPAMRQPIRPILREAISAALASRVFDEDRVWPQIRDLEVDNDDCNRQRGHLESGLGPWTLSGGPPKIRGQ